MQHRTRDALVALGFPSDLIVKIDSNGHNLHILRALSNKLSAFYSDSEVQLIRSRLMRQPIDKNVVAAVLSASSSVCAYCADGNNSRPFQVHLTLTAIFQLWKSRALPSSEVDPILRTPPTNAAESRWLTFQQSAHSRTFALRAISNPETKRTSALARRSRAKSCHDRSRARGLATRGLAIGDPYTIFDFDDGAARSPDPLARRTPAGDAELAAAVRG
jgi:hypothetical protein